MNIIIASGWGYPHKIHASNVKSEFIARGLQEAGANVLFMDALWGTLGVKKVTYGVSANGINYVSFPRYCGVLSVIPNIFNAIKVLRKHKIDKDGNVFISMFSFPIFPIEWFITLVTSYKRAMIYHEWGQCMGNGSKLSNIYGKLNDYYVPKRVHIIHPISHYLEEWSKQYKKPIFNIPILSSFDIKYNVPVKAQFTYCVSAMYLHRNTDILYAFKNTIDTHKEAKLILVVNQVGNMLPAIQDTLKTIGIAESTEVKMGLTQKELFETFAASLGLIIPLDPNNFQDKVRFSQKIAEYISTSRPIITSAVGEIPYFFRHKDNALIVEYSSSGYSDAMTFLLENKTESDRIGRNGYLVGEQYFNYKTIGKQVLSFYKKI